MTRTVAAPASSRWAAALRARAALIACALIGLIVAVLLPGPWGAFPSTRAIIGWNVAVLLYLAVDLRVMFGASHARMRVRALQHDEGRVATLVLAIAAAVICLGAIVAELGLARELHGSARHWRTALAALTILTAWTFMQVMFALHYAHGYYASLQRGQPAGIDFPGIEPPDYADFLYLSCVIGTSAQTADVTFSSRAMRRVATVHCVLAFFFNATLLALSINIASGLI
jgi:uncharacterized membrane protein